MSSKKTFLHVPGSIRKLQDEFRASYTNFNAKRDQALRRLRLTEDDWDMLYAADGSGDVGHALLASNCAAANQLVRQQLRAFRQLQARDSRAEFLHVTIVDKRWLTSDERTIIDLRQIKRQARTILSAMGDSWFAVIELSVFTNKRHQNGGKLLGPHVHAIVHGRNLFAAAQAVEARRNQTMPQIIPGLDPIRVQRIQPTWLDLARVIRYPWLAPDRCKTDYLNPRTGRHQLHESEAGDRYIRYLRQFQLHSLLQLNVLCFARGPLTRTRSRILKRTFAWLERRVPVARRRDELERMTEFWTEFMPRIGHARFQPPIIRG